MYVKPFQAVSAVNTGVPCQKVPIHRKLGGKQENSPNQPLHVTGQLSLHGHTKSSGPHVN
jgi:hypothetical protein